MSQSIIASIGFALFTLCLRMAGMANVIANSTNVNLVWVSGNRILNRIGSAWIVNTPAVPRVSERCNY